MQNNLLSQIDEDLFYIFMEDFSITNLTFEQAQTDALNNHASFWPYWFKQWNRNDGILLEYFQIYLEKYPAYDCDINIKDIIQFNCNNSFPNLLKQGIIPISKEKNKLKVLIALPEHYEYLKNYFSFNHSLQDIQMISMTQSFQLLYQVTNGLLMEQLYSQKSETIISKIVDNILKEALANNISDIHGDPKQLHFNIRFRKDGILVDRYQLSATIAKQVTNRLKIMSQSDLANTRQPQDGYLNITNYPSGKQDARIHFCPTIHGEKWAIRLLPQRRIKQLNEIDLTIQQQIIIKKQINQPQGLILITGPTGSGKTTTLYTLLNTLNYLQKNITTIEDPVEKQISSFNQIQINDSVGLDFPTGLKALLRQDPDIIMIGELRDQETANIALKAAQTGHLVFATLHSNSTAHTLSRLLAMGFHPELLSQTIHLIVAQRLIRTLCHHCFHKNDCPHCHEGYLGRMPIYEVMEFNDKIRETIEQVPFLVNNLEQAAKQSGMTTLHDIAKQLIKDNKTNMEEVNRVLIH